jgi:anti-sigma regulatory factor (Ser/Thr protein kinase)
MQSSQTVIPMVDSSLIGEARRCMAKLAREAGLNETDAGKATIIATELATNILRHAKEGEILLMSVTDQGRKWIEVMTVDRGPGMADVGRCVEDGFSTGGTAGTGLGAVRRMASEFDIYSQPPQGTIVFARLDGGQSETKGREGEFQWGAVSRPAPYETLCGDRWRIAERAGGVSVLIADGLGHGPEAAAAADEAAAAFDQNPFCEPSQIIHRADGRMRGTRGGALAVATVDSRKGAMRYAGVGNIAGHLRSSRLENGRGLVSHNGTVGANMRKVQDFDYDCPGQSLLVMHSDGLQTRWDLDLYPGLSLRHPAVIAGVLYRDFTRGRDDVTVVVVRFSNGTN